MQDDLASAKPGSFDPFVAGLSVQIQALFRWNSIALPVSPIVNHQHRTARLLQRRGMINTVRQIAGVAVKK